MNADETIREYEEQAKSGNGPVAMRDKRRTRSQGTSSSPTYIRMSSTSSSPSYHSTINSPFINNTIDLTADEEVSPIVINLTTSNAASPTVINLTTDDDTAPITNQELQQVLNRFPLNPKPARLSPDLPGFTAPTNLVDTPRGFNPAADPEGTRGYYILHSKEGRVCNLQPLTQTEVAELLAALPDSEGASPEPHLVQP